MVQDFRKIVKKMNHMLFPALNPQDLKELSFQDPISTEAESSRSNSSGYPLTRDFGQGQAILEIESQTICPFFADQIQDRQIDIDIANQDFQIERTSSSTSTPMFHG
jgi:hypothetical protein